MFHGLPGSAHPPPHGGGFGTKVSSRHKTWSAHESVKEGNGGGGGGGGIAGKLREIAGLCSAITKISQSLKEPFLLRRGHTGHQEAHEVDRQKAIAEGLRKIADPPPPPHKSVLESANPRMDLECASGCPWSTARATAPSPGRPTPGVVKQDKSSRGSVDTTNTRSDPQRVRMCSGERPIGAAKGKQSDTEALCQPPPRWLPDAKAGVSLRLGARGHAPPFVPRLPHVSGAAGLGLELGADALDALEAVQQLGVGHVLHHLQAVELDAVRVIVERPGEGVLQPPLHVQQDHERERQQERRGVQQLRVVPGGPREDLQ